jgi:hypothetical protein
MTPTLTPRRLATSQMARSFRRLLVIGILRPLGRVAVKSRMPWSAGRRPVATVVQITGELVF